MSRADPHMRDFAKRIIDCEADGHKPAENNGPETVLVLEKLRPRLAALMGNGGFRALLARALALAGAEFPWLRAVHVKADGTMEELPETHA